MSTLTDAQILEAGKCKDSGMHPWGITSTRTTYLQAARAVIAKHEAQQAAGDPSMPVIGAYEKPLVRQADAHAALAEKDAEISCLRMCAKSAEAIAAWATSKLTESGRSEFLPQAVPPLTNEQIRWWWASENGLEDCDMCEIDDFTEVVRAVEAYQALIRSGSK
jgi:hypothetical protein